MKTLVVVLALLVASSAAFAAETQTASFDVYQAFSYIGVPIVPITTSYPNTPLIFSGAGIDIEWSGNTVTKFDAPTQGMVDYQAWDPAYQWSMLLGEGYQVDCRSNPPGSNPTVVSFTGIKDGVPDSLGTMTDMWISLPGNQLDGVNQGGWHWIATPFNHAIPFNETFWGGEHIKITDGNTVRTLMDASTNSPLWIELPFSYFNGATQGWENAGYMTGVNESDQLDPGKMYIVKTLVDNLALIVPAYMPAP